MPASPNPKRPKAKPEGPSSPTPPQIISIKKPTAPAPVEVAPKPPIAPTPSTPPATKIAAKSPSATKPSTAEPVDSALYDFKQGTRCHPIPPVSERLQYRAIGLVKGVYQPDPEQFNRGILVTSDGEKIEAVLLGQVISLIQKYLDLSEEYLWVVYPRTRDMEREGKKDNKRYAKPVKKDKAQNKAKENEEASTATAEPVTEATHESTAESGSEAKTESTTPAADGFVLHLQIVGVWHPQKLQPDLPLAQNPAAMAVEQEDGYFSVRGEVVFNSQEKQFVMVKIQQLPRKNPNKGKGFKVRLEGVVDMKSPGYFWDLHARREANRLVITEANPVGVLPPRKPAKGKSGKPARPAKPGNRKPGEKTERGPGNVSRPPGAETGPRNATARPIRKAPSNPTSL